MAELAADWERASWLLALSHQEALDDLTAHLFGRRIRVTDRAGWSTERIVTTAHAQAEVEAASSCSSWKSDPGSA